MPGQFWFPSMSVPEIVDAFTGWGYSITNEQVAKPTPDFVLGIYTACMEQVTGITQEALQRPVEAALATVENPVRPVPSQERMHPNLLSGFVCFCVVTKSSSTSPVCISPVQHVNGAE